MAKSTVYRSFEVREAFGATENGTIIFETESRADADAVAEGLAAGGRDAQVFGLRSEAPEDGAPVLLRALIGLRAA